MVQFFALFFCNYDIISDIKDYEILHWLTLYKLTYGNM